MSAPHPTNRPHRPQRRGGKATRYRYPRQDRFTFWQDTAGRWRWQLVSPNGKIIDSSSQGFTRKWSARRNAILTTRRLVAAVFDR